MGMNEDDAPRTTGSAHRGDTLRACERYERQCALRVLAAAAAHEMSSPLNAILLNAQLARSRASGGDGALLHALDTVMQQVDQGVEASRKLLEFADQPAHEPHLQDAAALINDACEMAAPLLDRCGARLGRSMEELPRLMLDAVAFRAAVFILLRDASARGPVGVRIRVHAVAERDHVLVRVEDDGPALPEALLQRVFNPLRTDDHAIGQWVLGAGVVNDVVSRHGGTLVVRSGDQHGTRFDLRLPPGDDQGSPPLHEPSVKARVR